MSTHTEDIAWAAGIFNAHGYIADRPQGLTLRIRNKDLGIQEKVHAILGGRICGPYPRAHHDQYEWNLHGNAAREALRALLPHLVGDDRALAALA